MNRKKRSGLKLDRAAPAVCTILLLGLIAFNHQSSLPPERIAAYNEAVQEAALKIPYKIGNWIGKDAEIRAAAQRLLKPNVLRQRRYINQTTGQWVELMLVHCGTIRDMGGHYPPICYPAHGWQSTGSAAARVEIGPSMYDASLYTFERSSAGRRSGMTITNFFIIPSPEDPIIHDLDKLRKIGERRSRDGLGVAQIQIVTDSTMPADEREQAVQLILDAVEPVIRIIGDGIQ
jgi:hypothetical protein